MTPASRRIIDEGRRALAEIRAILERTEPPVIVLHPNQAHLACALGLPTVINLPLPLTTSCTPMAVGATITRRR